MWVKSSLLFRALIDGLSFALARLPAGLRGLLVCQCRLGTVKMLAWTRHMVKAEAELYRGFVWFSLRGQR